MSNLLLLFQHCHFCFAKKPNVSVTHHGTMISLEAQCDHCCKTFKWTSQPYLFGRFPAGNLLLTFAILCAGASVRKVLNMFKFMGVLVYSKRDLLLPPTTLYLSHYCLILAFIPEGHFTETGWKRSSFSWGRTPRQHGPLC